MNRLTSYPLTMNLSYYWFTGLFDIRLQHKVFTSAEEGNKVAKACRYYGVLRNVHMEKSI
jgi:hypothetical protein